MAVISKDRCCSPVLAGAGRLRTMVGYGLLIDQYVPSGNYQQQRRSDTAYAIDSKGRPVERELPVARHHRHPREQVGAAPSPDTAGRAEAERRSDARA